MKSRVQRGRCQFAALVRTCCEITTGTRGELVDFRPGRHNCEPAPATGGEQASQCAGGPSSC